MPKKKSADNAPTDAFAPGFEFRPNQLKALPLIGSDIVTNILLAGGGRSGKSVVLFLFVFLRAYYYPRSRHGIFRRTRNSCEATLFNITLDQVLNLLHPQLRSQLQINKSDLIVTLPNGSVITFDGLDENRREKILGAEWQTIWVNECNEFEYEDIEVLNTRLNGSAKHKDTDELIIRKMFFDCNPRSTKDWDCKMFRDKISPATNKPLLNAHKYDFAVVNNEDPEYLEQYANATEAVRNRYVRGVWTNENENAIFSYANIDEHRVLAADVPSLKRITVNIDPAVTTNPKSDLTGITVTGISHDGHAYVLADHSAKMTPQEWASKAVDLFDEYQADVIVAEKNQGGLMVSNTIYQQRANAPVKLVHASRGKEVRAEPVSILYTDGKVHHVTDPNNPNGLNLLEEEMVEFGMKGKTKSPDRMDSLVWGLTELFDITNPKRPSSVKMARSRVF